MKTTELKLENNALIVLDNISKILPDISTEYNGEFRFESNHKMKITPLMEWKLLS